MEVGKREVSVKLMIMVGLKSMISTLQYKKISGFFILRKPHCCVLY